MEDLDGLIWFVLEQAGMAVDDMTVDTIRDEVIRYYRSGSIDIPNYKTTLRNRDIYREYQESIDAGGYHDIVLQNLAREHDLTKKYVANLVRDYRKESR